MHFYVQQCQYTVVGHRNPTYASEPSHSNRVFFCQWSRWKVIALPLICILCAMDVLICISKDHPPPLKLTRGTRTVTASSVTTVQNQLHIDNEEDDFQQCRPEQWRQCVAVVKSQQVTWKEQHTTITIGNRSNNKLTDNWEKTPTLYSMGTQEISIELLGSRSVHKLWVHMVDLLETDEFIRKCLRTQPLS